MNYLLIILILLIFAFLGYHYIKYLQNRDPRRKAISSLFLGFTLLIGITSLLAEAIFEFLGLQKPSQFEWMAFLAYAIFAAGTVGIFWKSSNEKKLEPESNTEPKSESRTINMSGDNATYIEKADTVIQKGSKKKDKTKELTALSLTNPKNIIGRQKELDTLHQLLCDQKQVVVVNGMGGIGKTTLAAAYVFEYYDYYKKIAWLTQNEKDFALDVIQNNTLLKNLKIQTEGLNPSEIFSEAMNKLRNISKKPKLFIIDNANQHIEAYRKLLPSQPNWHVLLTSREEIADMHQMNLSFLDADDARALFQKHCKRIKDIKEIDALTKTVDYHTLTIEILAKTAELQRSDIKALKSALKQDLKANVKTKHGDQKVDRITSYLNTIFDLSDVKENENWLLKQFSCLPPEFHTYESLKELIDPKESGKEEIFSETLNCLVQKGWLIESENTYKMHRIISEVCLAKFEITLEEINPLLIKITKSLYIDRTKDNPIDKFPWIPFGNQLLKPFSKSEDPSISLLQNELALVLQTLGDYQGAKSLLEKSMKSDEKNFGENHPATVTRYSNLGVVLKALGDYQGAKSLLEKAVQSDEINFGENHPTTAIRYSNLALVLQDLGDYQGAKSLLEKALRSDEINFGENHPTTAVRYSNLATVLYALGEYQRAKSLLEKAMRSAEKNFGKNHPTTAVSYSNLATVLNALGDYQGAKSLLEKAIRSDEINFGENHPTTAGTYSNLALVLQDLGDYQGAKNLLEKVMHTTENLLGENHPRTAITYSNLATVLQDLGDHQGAKSLLEKAMRSDEINFGENHPNTAKTYSNLATVLNALGDHQGAKSLLEKAMRSAEKNFGENHPRTAITYSNLALVLKALGDYQGAKSLLEKAMRSDEINFGENHPNTARTYSNLATVLQDLEDYQGAKSLLEKALRSDEKNFGESHPNTAVRYSNLASVLKALGDYQGALSLANKALKIFHVNLPEGHPKIKILERNIAAIKNDINKVN